MDKLFLSLLFIGGSLCLGLFLYFVIPRPFRMYLQYRLQDFKHEDIPKDLTENWKYRNIKWWEFWKK